MRSRLLRPFLVFEFLLALQVVFTCWSEVGGQYHLDLMFWPWKLGLSVLAAASIVAITAAMARADGPIPRRVWLYGGVLVATVAVAGVVTYYYHLNEPADDDDSDDSGPQVTKAIHRFTPGKARAGQRKNEVLWLRQVNRPDRPASY